MTSKRITVLCLLAVLCPAFAVRSLAENLPTLSIRYMTIEADEIVVAEPVDSRAGVLPARYKVIRALKEGDIQVGQEVVIKDENTYRLGFPERWQKPGEKQPPPRIVKALLFLKRPVKPDGNEGYYTVLSGIRALSENKEILVPQQFINPGPHYLVPKKGENFEAMVTQVKRDLPVIKEIRELGTIADQRKRNEAIFQWIDEHKDEFGGGHFGRRSKGWASLEPQLFDWVMESCIPEDCWRAIELSMKLGTGPERQRPSFCSPRGRELLLEKAFDESLSQGLRYMALRELGSGGNFWYAHRDDYPRTRVVTPKEQNKIIDQVLPLLEHEDASWRAAGARCLLSASRPYDANYRDRLSRRGLPEFVKLYRSEKTTRVRNVAVEAIRRIGGADFWEELSGNPQGIVVFLRYAGLQEDKLEFHLNLDYTYAKITERPVFQFQELRGDGNAAKPLSVKPTVSYPKDLFTKGWENHHGMVVMTVPANKVKPGRWRVTVKGSWEGHTWQSEPVEVTVSEKTQDE